MSAEPVVLTLEGLFGADAEGRLCVAGTPVIEQITPLLGQRVRFLVCHLPHTPIVEEGKSLSWGWGSCQWQAKGTCPAGHHLHPDKMFYVSSEGFLGQDETGWFIDSDGYRADLHLDLLTGHYARLVAATVFNQETVTPPEGNVSPRLDALKVELAAVQDLLTRLRQVPK